MLFRSTRRHMSSAMSKTQLQDPAAHVIRHVQDPAPRPGGTCHPTCPRPGSRTRLSVRQVLGRSQLGPSVIIQDKRIRSMTSVLTQAAWLQWYRCDYSTTDMSCPLVPWAPLYKEHQGEHSRDDGRGTDRLIFPPALIRAVL